MRRMRRRAKTKLKVRAYIYTGDEIAACMGQPMQMKGIHKKALQALPASKKNKVFGYVYDDGEGGTIGAYPLYAPFDEDPPDENGVVEIGFVPSSKHAISSIALATRHYENPKGNARIDKQEFNQIVKRAASVLKYCRANTKPIRGSKSILGVDPRRVDVYEGASARLPARRKKAKKKAGKKVSLQSALTRAARRRRG